MSGNLIAIDPTGSTWEIIYKGESFYHPREIWKDGVFFESAGTELECKNRVGGISGWLNLIWWLE